MVERYLPIIGEQLKQAKKRRYPKDTLKDFALRVGVSKATYQKMEKGDLSVTLANYYKAAQLLRLEKGFEDLFYQQLSLFDD